MNQKELRVGNLIYDDEKQIKEVYEIHYDKVMLSEYGNCYISKCSGIPLSEKWLIKAGFKKSEYKWRDGTISKNLYWLGQFCINIELDYIGMGGLNMDKEYVFYSIIANVHQLQNLYFALTGQELTFTSL